MRNETSEQRKQEKPSTYKDGGKTRTQTCNFPEIWICNRIFSSQRIRSGSQHLLIFHLESSVASIFLLLSFPFFSLLHRPKGEKKLRQSCMPSCLLLLLLLFLTDRIRSHSSESTQTHQNLKRRLAKKSVVYPPSIQKKDREDLTT